LPSRVPTSSSPRSTSKRRKQVLRGLRTRYPSTPLVVAATVGETLDLGELLEGCTVVSVDAEPEQVAAAVRGALPSDSRDRVSASN